MLRKLGPLTYDVETRDGRTIKRHADHLKLRKDNRSVPDLSADSVIHDMEEVRLHKSCKMSRHQMILLRDDTL